MNIPDYMTKIERENGHQRALKYMFSPNFRKPAPKYNDGWEIKR